MKKAVKVISLIILILVVLIILTTVVLNFFVSPDFMRHRIAAVVSQKMHRKIVIHGRLSWSLFPRLKINVSDVELSNPDGFQPATTPFMKIAQLNLGVNPFELFGGNVEINYLALKGLEAHLIVNEQGQQNWVMKTDDISDPKKTKVIVSDNSGKDATPLSLDIGSIFLSNSNIYYQNLQNKQNYSLTNLNINASHIVANNPFDISISSDFDLGQGQNGQLSFDSEMLFDPQWKQIQFAHVNSQNQIKFNTANPVDINLSGSLIADRDKKHFSITEFDGKIDTIHMTGQVESNYQNADQPVAMATIKVDQFDPHHVAQVLNQPLPSFVNPDALSKVSGLFEMQASPGTLQIGKLQMVVDDSNLSGNATVSFDSRNFQFNLNLDQLDTNKYKINTPANANTVAPVTTTAPASSPTQSTQPSLIQTLSGLGGLNIDMLKVADITVRKFGFDLVANQGVYAFNPVKAQLDQGNYIGKFDYDSRIPKYRLKGAFTGIDAQKLLNIVSPVLNLQLTGKADINEELITQGNSQAELTKNLQGNVLFVVTKGVLHGIDLPYYYGLGKTLLSKQTNNAVNTNQTEFGTLSGTLDIQQGVATNKDFLVEGPIIQAHGSGTADLVNQQINFQLNVSSNAIANSTIPLNITGPFNHVVIAPDLKQVATTQIKAQAQQQLQGKVGDIIKKNLGDDTGAAVIKNLNSLLQKQ